MSNTLIAYYSRSGQNYVNGTVKNLPVGNTQVAAEVIAELTGGDLFRIETVKAYPADYYACTDEAQAELSANARPELATPVPDMTDYDTIYLGYPNWWGTAPMAVFTFLESADFSGKIIRPFCTHEGSGLGGSVADIQRACPGATVERGLAIRGGSVSSAASSIESWVK